MTSQDSGPSREPKKFHCADGVVLGRHFWSRGEGRAVVIVNAATAVLARYYHRYASYPTEHGFDVLTYDYRGIGGLLPGFAPGLERVSALLTREQFSC